MNGRPWRNPWTNPEYVPATWWMLPTNPGTRDRSSSIIPQHTTCPRRRRMHATRGWIPSKRPGIWMCSRGRVLTLTGAAKLLTVFRIDVSRSRLASAERRGIVCCKYVSRGREGTGRGVSPSITNTTIINPRPDVTEKVSLSLHREESVRTNHMAALTRL